MAEENGLLGAVAAAGGAIGKAVGEAFAAEKRLHQTMASGPASGQKFEVTKDTVLQAGKIISDQATSLAEALQRSRRDMKVELADGTDEVNKAVAGAWNSRLVEGSDSYVGLVEQYIASLDGLARQLQEAAKQYGFTDEDVVAAFGAQSAR